MSAAPIVSNPGQTSASGGSRTGAAITPYVLTAAAAAVYSLLALRRVWELRAGAFDAGFLDNVIYKVSVGLGNVSGLTGEAHYAGRPLVYVLGLPMYWINSDLGYPALLVMQAVSVALVGLAAWLIGDAIGLSRAKTYAAMVFVLASPAAYWATITELHTTGLSMGFVALAIAGAYRRWPLKYYWLLPLFASMARMEIGITIVVVGLLLWTVSRPHARANIVIGATVAVALMTIVAVLPTSGGTVDIHLGYLGINSLAQLPLALVQRPLVALRELLNPVFVGSTVVWLVMIGLVLPMRAWRWFLIAAPTLVVAALGSPRFADFWYQHYWNYVLVAAAVAFTLSLAKWAFSDRMTVALVAVVLCAGWIVGGPMNGPIQFRIVYPDATPSQQQTASAASTEIGALSTTRSFVLPGAHREWIYEFPTPFVCRSNQYTTFSLVGPVPDVVITPLGWERTVSAPDLVQLRRTLSEAYEVTDTIGTHTVRRLIPGASPALVDECGVVAEE